jgi:hypothetical protein
LRVCELHSLFQKPWHVVPPRPLSRDIPDGLTIFLGTAISLERPQISARRHRHLQSADRGAQTYITKGLAVPRTLSEPYPVISPPSVFPTVISNAKHRRRQFPPPTYNPPLHIISSLSLTRFHSHPNLIRHSRRPKVRVYHKCSNSAKS